MQLQESIFSFGIKVVNYICMTKVYFMATLLSAEGVSAEAMPTAYFWKKKLSVVMVSCFSTVLGVLTYISMWHTDINRAQNAC